MPDEKDNMYGDVTIPYFMKKEESFDLEDEIDWKILLTLLES